MRIINTHTIPHKKYTIPIPWNKDSNLTVTYYIAEIRHEGFRGGNNFQIHEKISGNDLGYGGATLHFLMENGTIEDVKGPFFKYPEGHCRILYDIITKEQW